MRSVPRFPFSAPVSLQRQLVFRFDNHSRYLRPVEHLEILCFASGESILPDIFEQFVAAQPALAKKHGNPLACASGSALWVGLLGGRLAGIAWSTGDRERANYFVRITTADTIIKSAFVPGRFRGRGIFPAILQSMVKRLSQERSGHIYIDCDKQNKASERSITKAGFRCIGDAWRLLVLGKLFIFGNTCYGCGTSPVHSRDGNVR